MGIPQSTIILEYSLMASLGIVMEHVSGGGFLPGFMVGDLVGMGEVGQEAAQGAIGTQESILPLKA